VKYIPQLTYQIALCLYYISVTSLLLPFGLYCNLIKHLYTGHLTIWWLSVSTRLW